MNPLTALYTEIIYRPLLNSLVIIYAAIPPHDLGLAIIILTVAVRLLLLPVMLKTYRSQRSLAKLQPEIREIQERYRQNREEQGRRMMTLYRRAGVNPLSGCLPMLIQLPILIGLYQLFFRGIAGLDPTLLYPAVSPFTGFNPVAFGLLDLAAPSSLLAVAAGVTQFLQGRYAASPPLSGTEPEFSRAMRFQTTYFFPVLIAGISWTLPAALAFYWTILNAVAIVEQLVIRRWLPG